MKQTNKSSLPQLFVITLVIVTTIAVGVAIAIHYDIKKDRIRDLHYSISVIKRYYELGFEQWGNALAIVGQQLHNIQGEHQDSLRLAYAKSVNAKYEELFSIGFTSPEGQVLTFSNSELGDSLPRLMDSPKSRRSFIKAKEAEFLSIGESYYFPNVEDWILPLRVPIKNESGEVIAVNTTAFKFSALIRELRSFGFDPNYKLLLVNDDFNVVQFYHPLPTDRYSELFGRDMDLLSDTTNFSIFGIPTYEAFNSFDSTQSYVLETKLVGLNHSLYAIMPQNIIWSDAQPYFIAMVIIYLLLIALMGIIFRLAVRRERKYLAHLVESEANLTSLFESTSSIIALFDRDKRVIEFNSSFYNYAKSTEDLEIYKGMDVIGKLKNTEAAAKFIEWQDRALSGEKFKETTAYALPDGTQLYFLFSYNPIYQDNQITGLSMFVENITELKTYQNKLEELVDSRTKEIFKKNITLQEALENLRKTQQRLIASEKMASLGLMAAGVGHEVNNPLNFIKNGATALKATLEDNETNIEEYRPFLDIIYDGVKRANSIVNSLSHFSRQVKSMDESCDINTIIENCLTMVQSEVKDRVTIRKNLMTNCPVFQGNEGRLHQALLNFINNAQQAIAGEGVIDIATRKEGNQLVVSIRDNGQGISKENIEKIADPFYTTKSPGEGTGLGLFISYGIIEEHSGEVFVESEPQQGTTFTLKFHLTT